MWNRDLTWDKILLLQMSRKILSRIQVKRGGKTVGRKFSIPTEKNYPSQKTERKIVENIPFTSFSIKENTSCDKSTNITDHLFSESFSVGLKKFERTMHLTSNTIKKETALALHWKNNNFPCQYLVHQATRQEKKI